MKKHHKFYILISITLIVSYSFYVLQPSEVEPPSDDTGRTREETEQFMREIGYVQ